MKAVRKGGEEGGRMLCQWDAASRSGLCGRVRRTTVTTHSESSNHVRAAPGLRLCQPGRLSRPHSRQAGVTRRQFNSGRPGSLYSIR